MPELLNTRKEMETLYEMTCRLGKGQGEEKMWDTIRAVSDAVDRKMSDKDKEALMAKLHGILSGGHFDEDFAMESVSRMYYTDKDGVKRHAPYWTIPDVAAWYEKVKGKIPKSYNEWDFFVTANMVASDNWMLLTKWWPGITREELDEKVMELAVNWLNDEDNPFGTSKIWDYLHPKE